jgi:hypothetical protein
LRTRNKTKKAASHKENSGLRWTEKVAAELKERIITRCRERLGEVRGMAEIPTKASLALRPDNWITSRLPASCKNESQFCVAFCVGVCRYVEVADFSMAKIHNQ